VVEADAISNEAGTNEFCIIHNSDGTYSIEHCIQGSHQALCAMPKQDTTRVSEKSMYSQEKLKPSSTVPIDGQMLGRQQ